jgi:hypothetical protein
MLAASPWRSRTTIFGPAWTTTATAVLRGLDAASGER